MGSITITKMIGIAHMLLLSSAEPDRLEPYFLRARNCQPLMAASRPP